MHIYLALQASSFFDRHLEEGILLKNMYIFYSHSSDRTCHG